MYPVSGIRCLFSTSGSGIRDPGWVNSQDPDLGSGINNQGSYFLELRNHFFGLNTIIRDGKNSDSGWKKVG
jgi:hypothetical protein